MKSKQTFLIKSGSGIVLYETIVAALVITLCVSVVLRTFTSSLRTARITEYYMKALTLLKDKSAEYFLIPSLEEGEYEGDFSDDFGIYSWRAVIEEIILPEETSEATEDLDLTEEIDEEGTTNFFSITLDILWKMQGKQKKISTVFFLDKTQHKIVVTEQEKELSPATESFEERLKKSRERFQRQKTDDRSQPAGGGSVGGNTE